MATGESKLNVLQVASSLYAWGGIERYVVYLTDGLTARGHRVQVTCPPTSPISMRVADKAIPLAAKRKFSAGLFVQYLRLFHSQRFDVVHIHFSPDFVLPALAAKASGQKCVIMSRHLALHWSRPKVQQYGRLFDRFIPVSDAVRDCLAESGISPSRLSVAKAGVPALVPSKSREEMRDELGLREFEIGVFGRLVKDKAVDLAIKAAKEAQTGLVVFGEGPDREYLERLAQKVDAKVRFAGFRTDVDNCMNAVDAVAIPSRWAEAFPLAALEAMSLGKAVVAARVGGLPELIVDGENGLLFEKDNVAELAAAFQALKSEELRNRFGAAARHLHQTEYTVERMAERIEAVYLAS